MRIRLLPNKKVYRKQSGKIMQRTRDFDHILWIGLLSIVCAVSLNAIFLHVAGGLLSNLPGWHFAHLANKAPSPLQFRWFSYWLPNVFIERGSDTALTYLAFRTTYLCGALFFIGLIAKYIVREGAAPTVIILAFTLYFATSTQAHFQFAEEPNILVFSAFIWLLIIDANFIFLLAIYLFGALTKDTVGFLIPFYFIYSLRVKGLAYSSVTTCMLSAIFISVYFGLRNYFGTDREYLGGLWQYQENIRYFLVRPDKGIMWALASIVPMAFLALNWNKSPLIVRCFFPSAILFVIGHLLISRIEEFRTYAPLSILLWCGAYAVVSRSRSKTQCIAE